MRINMVCTLSLSSFLLASRLLRGWMMAVLVLLLLLSLTSSAQAQKENPNTPLGSFCGGNPTTLESNFTNDRNVTLAEIRRQLSSGNVFYARAVSSGEGDDSFFGMAQCRRYLTTAECVACFDAGVSQILQCTSGAYVPFDNCFIRYENINKDTFNNPNAIEDPGVSPFRICGNQSASEPTTIFSRAVDGLLSDIKDATPKTSNFYVASTRKMTSENATVYSIGQCVENTSQAVCQSCLEKVYTSLYDCLPSTEGRTVNMGCFARYSVTPFFNDSQAMVITNFLKGHSSKVSIIAGAVGGVGLFLFVIFFWLLLRRRRKSKKAEEDTPDLKGRMHYDYKDLQLATNNFSQDNILGKGGFGEVFKAIFDDDTTVAVKKIEVRSDNEIEEFITEVKLISSIDHRNLLRLLGWSNEGSHLLLVIEYMPNGSLDKFLWGAKRGTLNWTQRYDIILGIAKGLAHLHNEFHLKIIHRDIKSSNILLDEDFRPKIADFGLARCQAMDQSHISTKFAGTLGYTAPEYFLHGRLSDKVDTYSFGIVILEIISGRNCIDRNPDEPSMDYLLEHAWQSYESNKHNMIIDKTMDANQYEEERVMHIIEIALLCTQSPASRRPTMSEILLMLPDGQSLHKRQLTRPTHIDHNRRIHIGSSNKAIQKDNVSTMQELEANV